MNEVPSRLAEALADRYRIERELGQGGMATVYLAHDLKHDRRVAVKVLHPDLGAALGGERFLAEIRTTARLQHPHILPLLDSGEAAGLLYYVMPLMTGETLRARLDRERQLPVDDALKVTREVADALAHAHAQGIIHRDIKPENILLQGGHALVADFGIALAVQSAGGERMTQTGLSLGTPQYMSPEQAMGERTIDARSDVYALGAVTYEMLAGEPPFTGPTVQAIVARVMAEQPRGLVGQRRAVPPGVEDAVLRALEKLPADRFGSAAEFAAALANPALSAAGVRMARHGTSARSDRRLLAGAAVLALGGLAVGVLGWRAGRERPDAPVVALTLELPTATADLARFAVSPDGARFAFDTDEGLAVRDSGRREYRVLPGTDGAESPSFSPDGQWLVYATQGRLRKVPLIGGAPIPVIPNDSLRAGRVRWGDDGTIAFESGTGIYLLSPAGELRLLAKAERAESPRIMPDGSGVFYLDTRVGSKLMYYDLAADSAFTILEQSGEGIYLPTGHLLYAGPNGGLFAIRFDPKRRTTSGTPIPVVADLQSNGGVSPFEVTRNGTLVYRSGIEREHRVIVREPGGATDTLPLAPRIIGYLKVSPDGRTLALTAGSARGVNRHTALYDVGLGSLTRFTMEGGGHAPVFSPDGRRLAFTADLAGGDAEDVFVAPLDRSTEPVRLYAAPNDQHASAWPSDSQLVVGSQSAPGFLGAAITASGGLPASIVVADPRRPGSAPRSYLQAAWGQMDAVVSPDGRWAAFTSLEGGVPAVYVRPFPVATQGGAVKVSQSGAAVRARWSGDGRTVFYHGPDGAIMATRVTLGETATIGATETVFSLAERGTAWDVDWRTGRMYLTQSVAGDPARVVVIQRWIDALRHDR